MLTHFRRLVPTPARSRAAAAVCLLLLGFLPLALLADDKPPSPAGTITALIPKDYIERGKAVEEAQKGSKVFWKDIIRTERGGRVRIGLTDGSILNIGSQTRMRILRHDEQSQQSELLLTYGKIRATVVKRTREEGSFQIRTPQAVAGVIGTEEFLDATPTATVVMALHGSVAVSSSNPSIVGSTVLQPGQLTVVFSNRPPEPPRSATAEEVQSVIGSTASDPVVTIEPGLGMPGTTLEAQIRGDDLAEATAVSFAQEGLAAELLPGATPQALPVSITIADAVPASAYTFTVETPAGTRTGNFIVYTEEVQVVGIAAAGFSLAISPEASEGTPLELARGGQAEVTVTLVPEKKFSGIVSLGVGPVPEGLVVEPAEATLSTLATEGAPPQSVTLSISATGNAPDGLAPIPVTAASGSLMPVSTLLYVNIGGVARGGFALAVNPATTANTPAELQLGGQAEFEVTLIPDPEFSGVVALSAGPPPQGVTVQPTTAQFSFEPGQDAPPPITFTVQATREAPLGGLEIQLFAAAEGFETRTIPIFVEITAPPPPVAAISAEHYYNLAEPPVLEQSSTFDVAQGARVVFDASESTAAQGFTVASYRWEIVGEPLSAQGPVFDLDTWLLTEGGTYTLRLTVQDDLGQTDSVELTLSVRELPKPEDVVQNCLQPGTESLQLSQFMACFDEQRFPDYPGLEEQTRNFFEQLSSARVFYLIANSQLIPGAETSAIVQVNPFEITFTTKTQPGLTQRRTDALTLRLLLLRYQTEEEWKIVDFASQTGSTILLSDFNLLASLDGFALTADDPLPALREGSSSPITVNVESLGGFTGTVELSVEDLPAGITPTFDPSSSVAAGSSTELVFSVEPTVAPADFEITLVGAVGQLRRTRTLLLRVTDFALTVAAPPPVIAGGDSVPVTVAVQAINGFTGTVELSPGALPAGLTATFAATALTADLVTPQPETTLTLTAAAEATVGTFEVTVVGTVGEVQRTHTLTLEVQPPPNLPPQAQDLSVNLDEDTSAAITLPATDADGDPLTFVIVTESVNGSLALNGNIATYTPSLNFNGSDSFTFRANDGQADSNVATVSITVNPINDAPVLTPIPDQQLEENTESVISITVQDVDGDPITLELVEAPSWASLPGGIRLAPGFDVVTSSQASASFLISLRATDDKQASDLKNFTVTVTNVNREPVIDPVAEVTVAEGATLEVSVTASDP
ncbi:MAG: Ig-like domain-containing protein, partial [Terriglobia bacterium]